MFLILAQYLASNVQNTSEQSNTSLKRALKALASNTLQTSSMCWKNPQMHLRISTSQRHCAQFRTPWAPSCQVERRGTIIYLLWRAEHKRKSSNVQIWLEQSNLNLCHCLFRGLILKEHQLPTVPVFLTIQYAPEIIAQKSIEFKLELDNEKFIYFYFYFYFYFFDNFSFLDVLEAFRKLQ